jgi:hypothetical protein
MSDYPRALDLVSSGRLELWPHNAFLLARFELTFLAATLQNDWLAREPKRPREVDLRTVQPRSSANQTPVACYMLASSSRDFRALA